MRAMWRSKDGRGREVRRRRTRLGPQLRSVDERSSHHRTHSSAVGSGSGLPEAVARAVSSCLPAAPAVGAASAAAGGANKSLRRKPGLTAAGRWGCRRRPSGEHLPAEQTSGRRRPSKGG